MNDIGSIQTLLTESVCTGWMGKSSHPDQPIRKEYILLRAGHSTVGFNLQESIYNKQKWKEPEYDVLLIETLPMHCVVVIVSYTTGIRNSLELTSVYFPSFSTHLHQLKYDCCHHSGSLFTLSFPQLGYCLEEASPPSSDSSLSTHGTMFYFLKPCFLCRLFTYKTLIEHLPCN